MIKIPSCLLLTFFALCAALLTSCKSKKQVAMEKDSLWTGLIAYYPFDDNARDESGNGNNGVAFGVGPATDRDGKPDAAANFDGYKSYIRVNDNAALRLSNTDFTINVWVKVDGYGPTYGSIILGKRGTENNSGWSYGIHGNLNQVATAGQTTFQVSGGTDPFAPGTKVIETGTWYMLTTVYRLKTKEVSFYINGVLDNTTNYIPSPSASETTPIYVGGDNPENLAAGYFFHGSLDDLSIYNLASRPEQIKKLFALPH